MRWNGDSLYLGRVYVGSVMCLVPEKWREFEAYRAVGTEKSDLIRKNIENMRRYYIANEAKPWRVWLMTNDDGEEIMKCATKQDAMAALEAAAKEAINVA